MVLSDLLHDADKKLLTTLLSSTQCVHILQHPIEVMSMKLHSSICAFARP